MIVHVFDLVESGKDGLIGRLDGHEVRRSANVEGALVATWDGDFKCCVVDCDRGALYVVTLHRRHSRRPTEATYLCSRHFTTHVRGASPLRIVVESNR